MSGRLREVSLTAAGGEIVGLAGLRARATSRCSTRSAGGRGLTAGSVRLPGGAAPRSPRRAVAAGVAYVSGDRRDAG